MPKPAKPKKEKLPFLTKKDQAKFSTSPAPGHLKKERVPCKICQACISSDCGECHFCADMPKFGGTGRLKLPCQMRQCLQPLLLPSLVCNICNLDGWYAEPTHKLIE